VMQDLAQRRVSAVPAGRARSRPLDRPPGDDHADAGAAGEYPALREARRRAGLHRFHRPSCWPRSSRSSGARRAS
jgi:hypothetical protein